jgi:serine/threonine protein kinase
MTWREGEQVGTYQLVEKLGQGGMATVYKAYHPQLDRHVAIKAMHRNFLEDESFVARFTREAQIVASLEHPHIVSIYDFGEHDGQPYLVMKYVPGETLKERLQEKPLSLDEILHVMQAVGSALHYAHQRDILHRDIKPSNIVIDDDNTPYLTDFGLARLASAGESTMSADMLLGTPHYISPEQAKGKKNINARADIYSLGIVLYELLVGNVPFTADTPYAIIHDHIYSPLPDPAEVNPEIPPAVEDVLYQALAKNPAERFASAQQMVDTLQQAIEDSQLSELSDERTINATLALEQMREARDADENATLTENTATPRVRRAVASGTEAAASDSKTPSGLRSARIVSQPTTWYQDERIWPIGGLMSFLVIVLLILGLFFSISSNLLELVTLAATSADDENPPGFIFYRPPDDRLIPEPVREAGVTYTDDPYPSYEIPRVTPAEAESLVDDFATHPLPYLLLARAEWQNNPDIARDALLNGLQVADNAPGRDNSVVTLYLTSAARIADDNDNIALALAFNALALETAHENTPLYNEIRGTAGQYIYENAADADTLTQETLSNLIGEQITLDSTDNVADSPAVRFLMTRSRLVNNSRGANLLMRTLDEPAYLDEEIMLLRGELAARNNNNSAARRAWDAILNTDNAPQWVQQRATRLLAQLPES